MYGRPNGLFVRQYFPHPSLLESIMKEFSGYLHNALTQFEGKGIIQEVSKWHSKPYSKHYKTKGIIHLCKHPNAPLVITNKRFSQGINGHPMEIEGLYSVPYNVKR